MRHVVSATFGIGIAVIATACGSAGTASSKLGDSTDPDAGPAESCYGVFHWLQKDAYSNTGGRSTPLWPPHTTTQLDVHCVDSSGNDQIVQTAFRDNHGTDPGAVDDAGTPFLVEVKSEQANGSRQDLLNLLGAYTQCECAPSMPGGPGTPFLSLTDAQSALPQQLLGQLVPEIQMNLNCAASVTATDSSGNMLTGTAALLSMLQSGDFSDAIAAVPSCSWASGFDWQSALAQAMTQVATATGTTLDGYHVCNNDAILEAGLWETFARGNGVSACDNSSSTCQGPVWYYTP
jgi:hypothetical protein